MSNGYGMGKEMYQYSRIRFEVPGSCYPIAVQRFQAREGISQLFEVDLWLVSEDEIALDELLQRDALLTLAGDDDRHFHGTINSFVLSAMAGRFFMYRATMVPQQWFMSLNQDFRIYQNLSAVQIAEEVLRRNHLVSDHYQFRLVQSYQKRRYCTQYGESDLHFISRILEEEGIFYFFEHHEDRHVLVFADDPIVHRSIVGEPELQYRPGDGLVADGETIDSFTFARSILPGTVTLNHYNFKRPSLGMAVKAEGPSHAEYERYEYPGAFANPEDGERQARTRLQEIKTQQELASGGGNCPRFTPGYRFRLAGHPFELLDREYLLISLEHAGSQLHVLGESCGIGGDFTYTNDFVAIPAAVPLRPQRRYAKPVVKGLQSALVVGPSGEEIHTDAYGRVKVQFHWDRQGIKDDRSSCWLRINQAWSGSSWGMIYLPRVGDEVLVAFLEGDPDWPVLVGNVNNASSPALYDLPAHKSRSGIKTHSTPNGGRDNFNELRFDDKKGSEEVFLQAERDLNMLVKQDKSQIVGRDASLAVDRNRKVQVGADQRVTVGGHLEESIGASKSESVTLTSSETVGAAKFLTTGGMLQVSIGGIMNETVAGAKTEEVGAAKAVLVGAHMTEKVAGSRTLEVGGDYAQSVAGNLRITTQGVVLDAPQGLTINAGGVTLLLKDGRFSINGREISLKASGEIVIKGTKVVAN